MRDYDLQRDTYARDQLSLYPSIFFSLQVIIDDFKISDNTKW